MLYPGQANETSNHKFHSKPHLSYPIIKLKFPEEKVQWIFQFQCEKTQCIIPESFDLGKLFPSNKLFIEKKNHVIKNLKEFLWKVNFHQLKFSGNLRTLECLWSYISAIRAAWRSELAVLFFHWSFLISFNGSRIQLSKLLYNN